MTFWLGFSVGAVLMFGVLFVLSLCATAAEADRALERYGQAWRAERDLYVVRDLDIDVPPKGAA